MKKLKKDILGFTGVGVGLGVGSQVVGSVGGNTAGLTAMSNQMPLLGTVRGSGHVMGMLHKLPKPKHLKKKRR